MVLKRFFTMALGALGLSALAAGAAFGQTESNVPSPDGFDDQLECSTNAVGAMLGTPNMKTNMGMGPSPLDSLLRTSDTVTAINNAGSLTLTETFPVTPNCGSGTIGSSSASYDLAQGYQAVYNAYLDVVAKRTALKNAEDTSGVSSGTANAARERLTEAQNKLDALSMGPIYKAGIAEWGTVPGVTAAIKGWNDAVGATNGTPSERKGYLGADQTLGEASYSQYRPISTGTYDSGTGSYPGGSGNFDNDQNFNYPPGTPTADLPTVNAGTVATIRTALSTIDGIIKSINDDIDDTPASANQRHQTLNDSLNKAKAERTYIQGQLDAAYADTVDLDGDNTNGIDSIAGRYATYTRALSAVTAAESALRGAVDTRVDASNAVLDHFTSADSYLAQNVYRHTYLVSQATTDAATKAARAKLTAAQELKAKFDSYFGTPADVEFDSENPAGDLLNALLKPSKSGTTPVVNDEGNDVDGNNVPTSSDGGDDGQALVDAVSSVHGNTVANRNAISDLEADIGTVEDLQTDVSANTMAIAANTTAIATERTERMAADTMLGDRITANTGAIGANTDAIEAEMTAREAADTALSGRIDANNTAIGANTGAIADNTNAIGSNSAAINRNSTQIGELNEALEVVRAGVAASMALAGMPAINGRGISIGVGSYDGESAFAVGFMIQSEMASFKVGITSAGGETGASAGVGFQF